MADISLSLAAGSTTPPYFHNVRITKQLCSKTSQTPVFVPVFTLLGYKAVGTNQYEALVNVQGIVTFTPCGSCCAKTQTISQNFVVPFFSSAVPSSVTVTGGTPINAIITNGCSKCGNTLVCDVPLSLTVA